MSEILKYLKKTTSRVAAVQLDLETRGFTYQKWGSTQTCKAGDWIVNNDGDVYTIDRDTFARTYRADSPGSTRRWCRYGQRWQSGLDRSPRRKA